MQTHPFGTDDIVFEISMFWLDLKTIGRLGATCKLFSQIIKNQTIWETYAIRCLVQPPVKPTDWYHYVRENSTIYVNLKPSDKHSGGYLEINFSNFSITIKKADNTPLIGRDAIMDEVFKRLVSPYTITQKGKTFVAYYFCKANNNIVKSQIVQDIALYCSTPKAEWLCDFRACENAVDAKNFTIRVNGDPLKNI